jgi:catechol 2,3-dioxygenase-like lactoylglutathione lyase family enzyme
MLAPPGAAGASAFGSGGRNPEFRPKLPIMAVVRMDNVGIVFDDLDAAVAFFLELGLELDGRMTVEGEWSDRIVGLQGQRVDIAMMRTPDGHSKLELMSYQTPAMISPEPKNAPANTLGIRRLMFAVDDIEDTITRLRTHGAELVGEVVRFEDLFLLCYLRGPEGVIVALAEELR